MTRHLRLRARILVFSFVFSQTVGATGFGLAADRTRRVARPCSVPRATATLGTFQPTPTITVRGNAPIGGGYSPLGIYGDQTMSLYGPFSPFRVTTAPVLVYVRGYDGSIRITEATAFSNPNLPELSPVRYPTEANYFYGPRIHRVSPWGTNAINWIDQN
ncbi:MAG: hypothetical protein ACHRXM_16340 [Isosphaerales bacterium]